MALILSYIYFLREKENIKDFLFHTKRWTLTFEQVLGIIEFSIIQVKYEVEIFPCVICWKCTNKVKDTEQIP